jgi:hypothetical protein
MDVDKIYELINELKKQKEGLMLEFFQYIKHYNLIKNKEYLISITPESYKQSNNGKDYYDLFFEINSGLDFSSDFVLKDAIEVFLKVVKKVEREKIIVETFF